MMIRNRIGIILDGDDTLWATQPLYVQAKKSFFKEMQRLGFNRKEIEKHFERIDISNVHSLGFSKLRFPKSMGDTYQRLCLLYNRPIDQHTKSRFEMIGYSVFKKTPHVFRGVREVLKVLRDHGLFIVLATKGDEEVQEKRLHSSNLNSYFDRIYVFPEKGESQLGKIVDDCGFEIRNSWSIGNSLKSDINPAVRIGMNAIWIVNETWDFEHEKPCDRKKIFRARSIAEVPLILASRSVELGV
jgi:putative hydrolase of the HAD superfamily